MPVDQINLFIQSPRGRKPFSFDKTAKVGEVIEVARTAFGFEAGAFVLKREKDGETLASERPLVSFHIMDGEVLILVPEMGSGV